MHNPKPLIVVCGGGFAREVIWLARDCADEWQIVGILDDTEALQGCEICGVPVLGPVTDWFKYASSWFVVALGLPRSREEVVSKMEGLGNVQFATLIHPSVCKSQYVEVGEGSIVAAGAILTTQISLGKHVIINLGCTIGHDSVLGDFCTLAPQVAISGNVTLGRRVEIGTAAMLRPGITVGANSFVGMGSAVTKDLPKHVYATGNPAQVAKELNE